MLTRLRTRLGISDTDKDGLLQAVLDDVTAEARSYCNFMDEDILPAAMEIVIIRLAMVAWRSDGYGTEAASQEVTQVKRGDVSTSMAAPAARRGAADLLSQLNAFRKLRW